MAWSLRTFAVIGACGAFAAACAHAGPAVIAKGAALPELGEDMPEAAVSPAPTAPAKLFSIDTPVGKLCGHPEAKAVVDRDLPGLTARPEYIFFKHMSLRQLQAASRGQMSEAALDKVSVDLGALGEPLAAPFLRASATLP